MPFGITTKAFWKSREGLGASLGLREGGKKAERQECAPGGDGRGGGGKGKRWVAGGST